MLSSSNFGKVLFENVVFNMKHIYNPEYPILTTREVDQEKKLQDILAGLAGSFARRNGELWKPARRSQSNEFP